MMSGLRTLVRDWCAPLAREYFSVDIQRAVPRSTDRAAFQAIAAQNFEAGIIFDVGAHRGNVSIAFHRSFPTATIYAFEPVQDTFAILQRSVRDIPNIRPFRLALGDARGAGEIGRFDCDTLSSMLPANLHRARKVESVQVATVDAFCREHQIGEVDILKTDTEGWDGLVLQGARGMLERGAITFILSEIGPDRTADGHSISRFTDLCACLAPYGYVTVGLFDATYDAAGRFKFCNVLFAHPSGF